MPAAPSLLPVCEQSHDVVGECEGHINLPSDHVIVPAGLGDQQDGLFLEGSNDIDIADSSLWRFETHSGQSGLLDSDIFGFAGS